MHLKTARETHGSIIYIYIHSYPVINPNLKKKVFLTITLQFGYLEEPQN